MADKGWIKIDRGIQEHWLWQNSEYLKAWLDLIMLANYEDKKIPYKGEIIVCKRGSVNLSITKLAQRWNCSRDKARHFLHLLENDNMVTIKATTNRTTITLVNYGKYQDKATTKPTTKSTTSKATNPQRADTTKKDKKDKEREEIYMPPADDDDDEGMSPEELMARWKAGTLYE